MSFNSQFNRPGARDDRRRRLLTEDHSVSAAASTSVTAEAKFSDRPLPHYGDGQILDRQPRLIDLAPKGLPAFGLLLLLGAAVIFGFEALYAWMPELPIHAPGKRTAALDLAQRGSLAGWFSSLTLTAASVVAVMVFSIRRYRTDDYQGHYRVWLWAALAWFVMATDLASGLHEALRDAMVQLTGSRLAGDGAAWWIIAYVLLLGGIGGRLALDMRACWLSGATLVLSAVAYLTALLCRLHGIVLDSPVHQVMLQQGAMMAGHLLVLLAMGLHLRHVILDAKGLLPLPAVAAPKQPKAAAESSDDAEEEDDEQDDAWVAVDSPHGASGPVWRRAGATAAAPSPPATAGTAAATAAPLESTDHKLSKAERKALKRRLLEDRSKRQQSGG